MAKLDYTIRKLPSFKETDESVIENIVKANVAAFDGDKFNGILLGDHWEFAPALQRAFAVDCLMGGHVYVVELDGKIIADAMWFGPGQGLMQAEGAAEAGFNKFMAALTEKDPDVAGWWGTYYVGKYSSFASDCLGGPEYKQDGWHLQVIAVHPEYQRHGIGRALIEKAEEEIKKNPEPKARRICLETEREGPYKFYEAMGFKDRGVATFEGHGDLGSSPMWCFAKEI
ncbi:acyl-CoA N-acyltransferase [Schizopora paradoxa]|uniref:Acyl-CoA N-acyltransferase n=1 Tax=Schizopora paradoxa TaxID=27342 RepID=A0A0H2R3W8_9AGAM|nr:acyl-CoA N-acyltransferase [Schizopora paradoxa]